MVVKHTSISWMRWLVTGLMVTDYTFACLSVQNDLLLYPIEIHQDSYHTYKIS